MAATPVGATTAMFFGDCSRSFRKNVVFPDPRKPVIKSIWILMVILSFASIIMPDEWFGKRDDKWQVVRGK
jgi:preprotein translocase subunit SecE